MAKKYLDLDGLSHFWQAIKNAFVADVTYSSTSKKIQKTKAGTTSDVVTLSTVATSGSYSDLSNKPTIPTLQNVFGKVKVGSTTIEADTTQDTLELVAGSNVTLTPDSTNDKVTIAATDTTYSAGTNITITGTTIATTAEVNQNAFSNVKVGSTTVAADAKTDTLELVAGSNVTLTPDATNDKVTIAATDTTYSNFTPTMSGSDGSSGLVPGPTTNTPVGVLVATGGWKNLDFLSGSTSIVSSTVADGWKLNVSLNSASASVGGLMSASDKTKLNGIASGAEVNVQSDWNQSTTTADDYIKNKPTLGAAAAKGVVTTISSDSANLPTVTAVKNYVATAITGAAAFQGTAPTTFAPTNYKKGYYWVVGTAGTYVGEVCEAGDMIFAIADYASAYAAADFTVIQTNLDITSITNAEIDNVVAA